MSRHAQRKAQALSADAAKSRKCRRNITKEKTEVENQAKDIAVEIGACFDQIIEIIKEQKLKMIEAASDMANEKIVDLDSQQKSFGCIASDVQEVIDFVERNVNNATHAELMSLQKQMTDRVEEMHHIPAYGGLWGNEFLATMHKRCSI